MISSPSVRHWLRPLLGTVMLVTAGCHDLLEENPLGTLTSVNFYQNTADAIAAINAAYAGMRSGHPGPSASYVTARDYFFQLETPGPQITAYSSATNVRGCWDLWLCSATNDVYVANNWIAIYDAINRANAVIDNVPGIQDMDARLRARITAEGKFLRAFHYFNLVRLFGGVPLFVQETKSLRDLSRERDTADEVYDQVVKDLTEAIPDLWPQSELKKSEWGHASRGAAQALLGKVYLQRGVVGRTNPYGNNLFWPTAKPTDLQNAITQLRAVVDGGQYRLVSDYGSLWRWETEINEEAIWSFQNANLDGQGTTIAQYVVHTQHNNTTSHSAGGELPFWESYAPGDVRRDATWQTSFRNRLGQLFTWNPDIYNASWAGPGLKKYLENNHELIDDRVDITLLRYADVLLMLAEAHHESGATAEARSLVDQVRARAGLAPLPASVTGAAFREALYWERNWELATEQHSWYDGQRFWDLYTKHVVANASLYPGPTVTNTRYRRRTVPELVPQIAEPKDRLKPIPSTVIDRNPNLVQNPGWQ